MGRGDMPKGSGENLEEVKGKKDRTGRGGGGEEGGREIPRGRT